MVPVFVIAWLKIVNSESIMWISKKVENQCRRKCEKGK